MDLNLVVLCGRLAVTPEVQEFESGSRLIRYLVTVKSIAPRRRVDVVPVVRWDPQPEEDLELEAGRRVWVAGMVQRRFWESTDGRRSRLEVVAHHVQALARVETSDTGSSSQPEAPGLFARPLR